MSALWTSADAAQAVGAEAGGSWQAAGVAIDSRSLKPGELFVALKGERFDGHDYAPLALANGAAAVVASRPLPGVPAQKLLVVRDTQAALESLGRFARARARAMIVGVTGSVGKTSVKEMLRLALGVHGETFASGGNLNNHIGTPLMLANLPPGARFAVFEMGMNHAGEISALTRQVRPHVAAITAVEAVHLEFFDSVDAIADAKAEIFEGVEPGGAAVINADNRYLSRLRSAAERQRINRVLAFGEASGASARLLSYVPLSQGCEIVAELGGRRLRYALAAVGKHWAASSLLVLCVAQALELDAAETASALAGFEEIKGRGRRVRLAVGSGSALLIDDSYNASPASMRAAFAKLSEAHAAQGGKGRKLAALGDMLEMGPGAAVLHAELARNLVENGVERVFTAGDLMRSLHEALPAAMRARHVRSAMNLLPLLESFLEPGDVLLIKGSHGSSMHALAEALQCAAQNGDTEALHAL